MASQVKSISVILPCYNAEKFIARAIDSVLRQKGTFDIELIIVDDKSKDGSIALLEKRYGVESRIRLIRLERNYGPAFARNAAIKSASHDWIAVIDADDEWRSDRLVAMTAHCEQADFIFDNLTGYDHRTHKETGTLLPVSHTNVTVELMASAKFPSGYDFGFAKPIIRRTFLDRMGLRYPDLRCNEDLLFYLDILAHGARAVYLPEAYYIYTTRIGQASRLLSPASTSQSNNLSTASALEMFIARNSDRLTHDQTIALTKRMKEFRDTSPLIRIYDEWLAARYHKVPILLLLNPSLFPVLVGKFVRRIRRRLAKS